jgi:hypothetical protein
MNAQPGTTEAIVRNHLQAFVEQKGIAAILSDYADNARFHSETKTYQGKQEIGDFFASFIASLPAGATERFLAQKPASRRRARLHYLERGPRDSTRHGHLRGPQRQDRLADIRGVHREHAVA